MASAASVLHGRWFVDIAPEVTAAGTLTAAAIVLVPLCFVFESPLQSEPSAVSVAALSVNAIVATALGFAIYFRLIRTIGSVGTASAGYLKLAVGVFIGCAFMGEALTWTASIGLLAILVGVSAINQKQAFRGPAWFATRFTARTSGITKRLTRTSVVLKNCRAEKVHII
jgi:drug/metabolite transporter (DMT)-like permease